MKISLANGEEIEVTEFDKVLHKNDGGVYLIYNIKNKKGYVGYTHSKNEGVGSCGFVHRIDKCHLRELKNNKHYNEHLQRSWTKYGKENFKVYVLEMNADKQREEHWIDRLKTSNAQFGYNKTLGGDAEIPNEETRQKMSEAMTGMFVGEKNPFFGKNHSEEARQKMSEAVSGKKHPMFGKNHSEETKQKMSEAKSGEKNPNYGKLHSEETKRKISEANFGEKHPSATITEETATNIKKLIKFKKEGKILITHQTIADMYGTTKDVVQDISRGKTWKHIEV